MSTSWLRLTPELTAEQGQEAQTESAGTRIARRGSLRERLRGDETPRPGQPSDEVRKRSLRPRTARAASLREGIAGPRLRVSPSPLELLANRWGLATASVVGTRPGETSGKRSLRS